ncbi:hypothetical protein Bhyg_14524 [Pseudolycoriella hygida]|uniref:Uncharacterized protein n=1 Tax=Pseudolycoriella hygida TaxID=35572 RepID=A0A9Q0RXK1_9DIPT|nr:hypothetical protein Bhyg_14524 [Pseudolycoriella hygida]
MDNSNCNNFSAIVKEELIIDDVENNSDAIVKEKRVIDDVEMDEMVEDLEETNRQKAVRANDKTFVATIHSILRTTIGGQSNIMNNSIRPVASQTQLQRIAAAADYRKEQVDEESVKGRFGWTTVDETHIPFLLRQSEKYCSVRMVGTELIYNYSKSLHPDILGCVTIIPSFYVTQAESRLLNEINHIHCDWSFSQYLFTEKDVLIKLSDVENLCKFFLTCYKKLTMGANGPSDKCGFFRINNKSAVPYIVRNGERFVPLLCFEGETENLKLKIESLSGWDLCYIKFCCTVQGILKELYPSGPVNVIRFEEVKDMFPTGTEFRNFWPDSELTNQYLVPNPTPIQPQVQMQHPTIVPVCLSTSDASMTAAHVVSAAGQALTSGWPIVSQNPKTILPNLPTASYPWQFQRNAQFDAQGYVQRHAQGYAQPHAQGYAQPHAQGQLNEAYVQQAAVYVDTQMQHTDIGQQPCNAYNPVQGGQIGTRRHQLTVLIQAQPSLPRMQQCSLPRSQPPQMVRAQQQNQVAKRLARPPHIFAEMCGIPERPLSLRDVPYKIERLTVFDKLFLCVNMCGYHYTDYLCTLPDLKKNLFSEISIGKCMEMLKALKITIYIGNSLQRQTLRENGVCSNAPLVKIQDIIQYINQLHFMAK